MEDADHPTSPNWLLSIIAQMLSGMAMGSGMTDARVLHSIPSPDDSVIAYVIADDCGATCGCATRVDIASADKYYLEVFRSYDACDLTVEWKDSAVIEILDADKVDAQPVQVNLYELDRE
jgi:hypothetical protein